MIRRGATIAVILIAALLLVRPGIAQNSEVNFFSQGLRPNFAGDVARLPDAPVYTYELELIPDFEQTVLTGSGQILYTNTTPDSLGEVVLRLYPNLSSFGGDAIVSSATINGAPVTPALDETRSIASFPLSDLLPPGEQITLGFNYSVTVFHGQRTLYNQFSYLQTELALASVLPLLSVYDVGRGWWRGVSHPQGDAVYSEVGNFDVTIISPSYLTLIASGTLVEQTPRGEQIVLRYSAPLMRDFAIMASGQYQTLSGTYEDVSIDVHYLEGGRAAAQKALDWSLAAMDAYTQTFGPYVYRELDVVQTYTSAGGIEYPGLIVVANAIWDENSAIDFEWVTVHEVGHQWWYSMVGNDQTLYPWLDEALTEYSVAVYEGFVRGQAGYDDRLGIFQRQFTDFEAVRGVIPIGQAVSAYDVDAYSMIVYRKGGAFFDGLLQLLGPDAFRAGLQTYLSEYRYRVATPGDLQTVLEQSSGLELDDWFNLWVGYSN